MLASLLGQPGGIGFDIVVAHAHRRLLWPLLVARFAGLALAARTGIAIGDLHPGFTQVGRPFASSHRVATDGEGFGKGHLVQRAFIGLAADFVIRGAHHEAAGGQHEHFRACGLAVAKHRAGFVRAAGGQGREAAGGEQCRQAQVMQGAGHNGAFVRVFGSAGPGSGRFPARC
ncbi:hypothetical protein D3C76_1287870 [compost metagenome]